MGEKGREESAMKEILRLEPVFKQMIWGGTRMKEWFNYEIPGNYTGEAWVVSAHPQGDCRIQEGRFAGKTLSWLWQEHRELFGNMEGDQFPLLVKIIDAREDLSIQVHPDDTYAWEHEGGALGKTECWYILDCGENADIIVGHHAKSREEMEQMIRERRWSEFLNVRSIHKGDFFQINSGTVHAIKQGTLLIEIQQNSTITYRIYDYDRLCDGKLRELHLEKSLDVIRCPYKDIVTDRKTVHRKGYDYTRLVSCPNYTVDAYKIRSFLALEHNRPFQIVSVIDGEGSLDRALVKKGDHMILPCGYGTASLEGQMEIVVSGVPNN